jgi:hypothetical protein
MKLKSILLTAVATISLAAATMAQVPDYVPTNGLVGWWPFNGNANDESGNGNNGTVVGSVSSTTDRNANSNAAFDFPGSSDSYINLGAPNILKLQNEITISVWFTMVGGTYGPRLLQFGCGGQEFRVNALGTSDTSRSIEIGINGLVIIVPNVSCPVWNNIIYTASRSTGFAEAYLNGTLVSTMQLSPILSTIFYSTDFNIGRMACPLNDAWGGKIDDIGIWNRVLTQQEITDLYNTVTINCANNTSITPQTNSLATGSTATFTATTTDPNPSYVWQSDLGQGFQTLNNFGNYSGVNTATLNIADVQLPNHTQPIRVISTSGNCIDTSSVAVINVLDTCITSLTINDTITTQVFDTIFVTQIIYDTLQVTVYDTLLTTVTDTLVINALINGINSPNNLNTLKVFPNPASTHITIDYGNYNAMSGYTLIIVNSVGQTVFTTPINQQTSHIDLSSWTGNGIYFLQLIDPQNNTIENRKIVIQ